MLVSVNGAVNANDGDDQFNSQNLLTWHFAGEAGTGAAFGTTNFYEYYAIAPSRRFRQMLSVPILTDHPAASS